jgi:hypothetical protein
MRTATTDGNPRVETDREYDPDSKRVVWIADRMIPEIDPAWTLMIGDCLYNLRCALDHLWWQFAIDSLGEDGSG